MSAQKQTEGKSSVFIDYFAHPSNVKDSWAEALRSKVIEGIQETNRVLITDVDAEDALRVEKARRENGELSAEGDASRLAVMTQLGANYLLQGTITSLSVDHKRSDDGKSEWYAAVVNYTLKHARLYALWLMRLSNSMVQSSKSTLQRVMRLSRCTSASVLLMV